MWSMAALAAEAADDRPRALMMAAPRWRTVGMYVSAYQAWSFTSSAAFCAVHLGVEQVGELGGRVVAPDRHLGDVVDRGAGLGGELGHGTVVVEAGHRGEAARVEVGGVVHGDERVGVGRVADHQDLDVAAGCRRQRLALRA
jgi:hypothetical protein